jgi:hypothetical protein
MWGNVVIPSHYAGLRKAICLQKYPFSCDKKTIAFNACNGDIDEYKRLLHEMGLKIDCKYYDDVISNEFVKMLVENKTKV